MPQSQRPDLTGVLAASLAGWPVEAAVAVTDADATIAVAGRQDRVWPWASVTKLLTAVTVQIALEEGTVDLDAPAGPPGATLRHLLAHASGLGPDDDTVMAAPGTRRIYSNRGFEVVGETLADAAGMPFADYAAAAVLEPLGMTGTSIGAGGAASGAAGPLADLVRLGRELLAPTLLDPATLDAATAVAFPGLDGVLPGYGRQSPNDWGLGFERRAAKSPHWTGGRNSPDTFGHFGRSGSFLWVDPVAGLACAELAAEAWGPWTVPAWPALADAVLAAGG